MGDFGDLSFLNGINRIADSEHWQQKRDAALLTMETIDEPTNWRFLPEFNPYGLMTEGVYIARKLMKPSDEEMKQLEKQGIRIATLQEFYNANTPFSHNGYDTAKRAVTAWGQQAIWTANRLFIEEGVGVSGIIYGPSPIGRWATVYDAKNKQHPRVGSAWNTGTFERYIGNDNRMSIPDDTMAQVIVNAALGKIPPEYKKKVEDALTFHNTTDVRLAGDGSGKHLEENEALLLVRPMPTRELLLHQALTKIQGNKLVEDSGISIRSIPEINTDTGELIIYFAAGLGCSRCGNLEDVTRKAFEADVQSKITAKILQENLGFPEAKSINIALFPEYRGWKKEGYSDTLLSLAIDIVTKGDKQKAGAMMFKMTQMNNQGKGR